MSRRLVLKAAGAVVAAAALCAVGAAIYQSRTRHPKRFIAVVPGRIYRSGQPDPAQLDRIAREKGFKTLVNLRREDRWLHDPNCVYEREFAEKHGIRFVGLALDLPPTEEQIRQVLDLLDDDRHCPVLVHCSAGVERSGMVAAIYRVERMGWSNERALEELLANGVDKEVREHSQPLAYVEFLRTYRPHFPKQPKATPAPVVGGGK